jgi:hypothetical protein
MDGWMDDDRVVVRVVVVAYLSRIHRAQVTPSHVSVVRLSVVVRETRPRGRSARLDSAPPSRSAARPVPVEVPKPGRGPPISGDRGIKYNYLKNTARRLNTVCVVRVRMCVFAPKPSIDGVFV